MSDRHEQRLGRWWEAKSLDEMSEEEWEQLCDGCGKCCLYQLEDGEQPGRYFQTNVACRLLDQRTCRCRSYNTRHRFVSDCIKITPRNIGQLDWLPDSCAYRRLWRGLPLPDWHPLVTGNPSSTRESGHSVAGRVISEDVAGPIEQHIIIWDEF
ncbi:MAG: YcgN family cysteine cluster protein [Gammaproteobacteria bacterium]|nr:MAG: YcgN family cysteine cluster protein [Gammaproteobacteria bacterium]